MAAGLKADAAFARWKQGRYAGALCLYVKVLELLEEIPSDTDLQARYVHATVRYCLGGSTLARQTDLKLALPSHPQECAAVQTPTRG